VKTRRRTEITIEKETSIRVTRATVVSCPFCGGVIAPRTDDGPAAAKPEEKK
jgi:hypothetical protein